MTEIRNVPSTHIVAHESGPGEGAPVYGEGLSLVRVANVLLRHGRLFVIWPLAGAVAAVLLTFVYRPQYTAQSVFLPQSSSGSGALSQMAGLAAQFGFAVPSSLGSNGESPEFYAELLRSENLLRETVLTDYAFPERPESPDTLRGNLIDLWRIRGGLPEDRVRRAVDRLRGNVSVRVGLRTNLVTLVTTAPWPGLAAHINQRLLDLVSRFNLATRRSQAAAERGFVEGRLAQAREEMADAERSVREFLQRNRRFQGSPELSLELTRLQRSLELRQQLYASLSQAYEKARIEEVRNTPVVTVVDEPGRSVRRASRHLLRYFLLGGFLGVTAAVLIAFGREYLSREAERYPGEFAMAQSRLAHLLSRRRA